MGVAPRNPRQSHSMAKPIVSAQTVAEVVTGRSLTERGGGVRRGGSKESDARCDFALEETRARPAFRAENWAILTPWCGARWFLFWRLGRCPDA